MKLGWTSFSHHAYTLGPVQMEPGAGIGMCRFFIFYFFVFVFIY
jgi:hypothetical protein